MAASTVNGSGNGTRSGAQTLVLLATPLNSQLLRALAAGVRRQADLRKELGLPAQTTLRAQLKRLIEGGIAEKHHRDRFPGTLEYELTAAGCDLLFVADTLERWLEWAPSGPLELGGAAAKGAVKALAEAWSTTMIRALAAGPLSLTELDGVIGSLSYPSLERRLSAMKFAGQVAATRPDGRSTPYGATEWLRRGIAPLIAACRWERRHQPRTTAPLAALDLEAVFLLSVRQAIFPSNLSGSCRLAVDVPRGERGPAGTMVELARGNVVACHTRLDGPSNAWALGSVAAWLSAIIESDLDRLELGGECDFARALVEGLHRRLFEAVPETV